VKHLFETVYGLGNTPAPKKTSMIPKASVAGI